MKRFKQQLCRGAMKVYQIILLLFSCLFIPTLALDCEVIRGNLKQIDAGSGSVVGVNDQNEVFILFDNVFTKINVSLKHISVGPGGQIGVDAENHCFRLQGGRFVQIPGLLKQVDAGGDQVLAGVSPENDIFCLNMDPNSKKASLTGTWVQIPGKMKYYSCGPYSCWGVDDTNHVFIKKDVSGNSCAGSGNFVAVNGILSLIEVATDGSVFGITDGLLYYRADVSRSNPIGTAWYAMFVCPSGHKHVSFDLGILWVVCTDGSIRRCTL